MAVMRLLAATKDSSSPAPTDSAAVIVREAGQPEGGTTRTRVRRTSRPSAGPWSGCATTRRKRRRAVTMTGSTRSGRTYHAWSPGLSPRLADRDTTALIGRQRSRRGRASAPRPTSTIPATADVMAVAFSASSATTGQTTSQAASASSHRSHRAREAQRSTVGGTVLTGVRIAIQKYHHESPEPDRGSRARSEAADVRLRGSMLVVPEASRPEVGELRPEKHDQRRVVDPDGQHDQRAGGAIGRTDARVPEIGADEILAEREQCRGDHGPEPDVAPGDVRIGQDLEDHREEHCDDGQREERIDGVEHELVVADARPGRLAERRESGAGHQRDQEQEPDAEHHGQRQQPLLEEAPRRAPHRARVEARLDLPDAIEGRLELHEHRGGADEQQGRPDHDRANALPGVTRVAQDGFDHVGAVVADHAADLRDDLAFHGGALEGQTRDGDHDQYQGRDREERVVRQGGGKLHRAIGPVGAHDFHGREMSRATARPDRHAAHLIMLTARPGGTRRGYTRFRSGSMIRARCRRWPPACRRSPDPSAYSCLAALRIVDAIGSVMYSSGVCFAPWM